MRALQDLETMGYTFTLDGDALRFTHAGGRPDPAQVRPLLEYVRRHKVEAVRFVEERLEAGAEQLLARCDDSPEWARKWAELHDRWGIPCSGFPTWAAWAEDVAMEVSRR